MGSGCSKSDDTTGSRRLSLTVQPKPVLDLPPNVNQDGEVVSGNITFEYSCVSVAGTYFQPSMNPFKGNTKYKTNQDSFFVTDHFRGDDVNQHLFGVLDGHGSVGHYVSQYVAKELPVEITKNGDKLQTEIEDTLKNCYLTIDQKMAEDPDIDVLLSGTTCNVCYVKDLEVYTANCGDSRAVLGYQNSEGDWLAKDLSDDHKPDLPEEKKRIESKNGRVAPLESWPDGPHRVWLASEDIPGLAMSRSFGDQIAHSVGVSTEPETKKHVLDPSTDRFIILASDGVWEFITSEQAVNMVGTMMTTPRDAAELLCKESVERWQEEEPVCDDITAVVIFIRNS